VKNNRLLLILGAALVVILAVGFLMFRGGGSVPGLSSPEDLVASALTGSGSVKCEYTGEDGAVVTAYVKNGMVRTDVTGGPEGDGSFLMKDKTVWTWQDSTKQGMTYTIPDVAPVEGETAETEGNMSDEVERDLEQYKDSCTSESIPDSMFEVPGDVTFQDFSQMMGDGMQALPEQLPLDQVPPEYQQYLNQ
jgi:hypothetical protein